jgi:hypothetical protein
VPRRRIIGQPGLDGVVTDVPAYALAERAAVAQQDACAPEGVLQGRYGWTYDGTWQLPSPRIGRGIARNRFVVANRPVTVAGDEFGYIYFTADQATATALISPNPPGIAFNDDRDGIYYPRAVYNDEVIFCCSDGHHPIIRYSGGNGGAPGSLTSPVYVANQAVVKHTNLIATAPAGMYIPCRTVASPALVPVWPRALTDLNSVNTAMEGIRTVTAGAIPLATYNGTGYAFPAVPVYSAGTITGSPTAATGTGTAWQTGAWGKVYDLQGPGGGEGGDALLSLPPQAAPPAAPTPFRMYEIQQVNSNTSIKITCTAGTQPLSTDHNYAICRRLPFKDVAVHQESLWGAGVAQYPGTVYVGDKGWNLAFPVGFTLPFDPSQDWSTTDSSLLLMNSINVPAVYDGDPIVALLSSSSPLMVVKHNSIHGIFGDVAAPTPQLLEDGVGATFVHACISVKEGQFVAGGQGVFQFIGGRLVRDLTRGRINRQWRNMVQTQNITNIACGVTRDHLFVSVYMGSPTNDYRTFVFDLTTGALISDRFTNCGAHCFFSARVAGEMERLMAMNDQHAGRGMDFGPTISGIELNAALTLGTETRNPADGDGNKRAFSYTSPSNLAQFDGVDGQASLMNVRIHTRLETAASGGLDGAIKLSEGLGLPGDQTKTLARLAATPTDRVVPNHRIVNRQGRRFQLTLTEDPATGGMKRLQVPEVVLDFRDSRRRV